MKKIFTDENAIYVCFFIASVIAFISICISFRINRDYKIINQLYLADEDIISDLNSREYNKTQQRDICFRRLSSCVENMYYIANSSIEITKDVLNDVTLTSCKTRTSYMLYQNMNYVKDFVSYLNLQR